MCLKLLEKKQNFRHWFNDKTGYSFTIVPQSKLWINHIVKLIYYFVNFWDVPYFILNLINLVVWINVFFKVLFAVNIFSCLLFFLAFLFVCLFVYNMLMFLSFMFQIVLDLFSILFLLSLSITIVFLSPISEAISSRIFSPHIIIRAANANIHVFDELIAILNLYFILIYLSRPYSVCDLTPVSHQEP